MTYSGFFKSMLVVGMLLFIGGSVKSTVSHFRGHGPAIRPSSYQQDTASSAFGPTSTIVLSAENTLVFNTVVSEMSVATFQVQLQEMSQRLPADADIIVVMDTPGGDVEAGNALIDSIKGVPQPVKTLTIFAASMGFHIVENADQRMILPNGVLMSHRAKGGVDGEFDGSVEVRFRFIKNMLDRLNITAANRMGLSLADYKELIHDEYWARGSDAVSQKAADTVVAARCDSSLSGTEERKISTPFGVVALVFSKCPLITMPLGIATDKVDTAEHATEIKEVISLLYSNPKAFVSDYIQNDKFKALFL